MLNNQNTGNEALEVEGEDLEGSGAVPKHRIQQQAEEKHWMGSRPEEDKQEAQERFMLGGENQAEEDTE